MEQEENKSSKFAVISIIFGVLGLLTALFYGGVFGIIGAVRHAQMMAHALSPHSPM